MQFKFFVAPLLVALAAAAPAPGAAPEENHLAKRTCGTFHGSKLALCQQVCKVACTIGTAGLAQTACQAACELPPLKREEAQALEVQAAAAGTQFEAEAVSFSGWGSKACNIGCDFACNSTVLALAQTKCLEICKKKCD